MASSNNGNELDHIQRQINQKTNDSLESTRNMVNLVAQSQEMGTNTMVMLDEQDEKLDRIEVRLFILRSKFTFIRFRLVWIIFMVI